MRWKPSTIADVVGGERTVGCVIELSSEMFTPGPRQAQHAAAEDLDRASGGPSAAGAEGRLAEMQALLRAGRQGSRSRSNILAAKWTKLVVKRDVPRARSRWWALTLYDALKLPGMRELIIEIGEEAMARRPRPRLSGPSRSSD